MIAVRYRSDSPFQRGSDVSSLVKNGIFRFLTSAGTALPLSTERNSQMATKTKAIEVKVDERLAEAISDNAVKSWHATNYSNGKKRVYVTFEEVVSA